MIESNIKSPGVYINEVNTFPNSVVAVPTAVPAFIGYTPQAVYGDKSCTNVAVRISSFAEFETIYCFPDQALPASPAKQYSPQYYLVEQKAKPGDENYLLINTTYYTILPDANTIYYLYNSIKLFYQNGGGDAYIVSVGGYGAPSNNPMAAGQIINANVKLNDLLGGLALLKNEEEPTMYICPEATLLTVADNGILMQEMLSQCAVKQTVISIFDVIGGRNPDPVKYTADIATFRDHTGVKGLDYGTAYYPFIGTTMMVDTNLDYTNLFGGDISQLKPLINPSADPDPQVAVILHNIENPPAHPLTVSQNNMSLVNASKTYASIMKQVLALANILPPNGAIAGVITNIDNQRGVWNAPANTGIVGAVSLPINMSDEQQANLNVDEVSGKSINAIRFFNGRGILVWGARTLDGNSNDWKYLSVRRTMVMLEQSCKLAAMAYIFAPNTADTWVKITSEINSFLTSIWKQGGLQGATPSDAFSVECGLGTTMTSDDLLNGYINVIVTVAVAKPAEFIAITFQQKQLKSN